MSKFHHPYHFIPTKKGSRKSDIPAQNFQESKVAELGHVTHHRYANKTKDGKSVFSGRIVCKLTNKTPLVLGGERKTYSKDMPNFDKFKDTNRVLPFELNGQPAIPASTLRGMVTSLAEAASDSALRVLDSDYVLSYRMKMPGLGALGMIVTSEDEQGNKTYSMRPLALPPIQRRGRDLKVPQKWADIFPEPNIDEEPVANLKVYVHGYNRGRVDNRSFLSRENPKSYSADNKEYWYLPLPAGAYIDEKYNLDAKDKNFLRYDRREQFVLGQKSSIPTNDEPIDQAAYNNLLEDKQQEYTRGVLRVLGIDGRGKDIPNTKKHEVFLPYPEWMEDENSWPLVEIPKDVIKTYERLADQRAAATEHERKDSQLPFHPKGRNRDRHENGKKSSLRLRDGDIVYFDAELKGEVYEVNQVSFSSIWRGVAGGGGRVKHFLDEERLPFNQERQTLSIAEQLFGFVSSNTQGENVNIDSRNALKSRVRFSFGTLAHPVTDAYQQEGLMKILDSPKPPSPAFYFKSKEGTSYIEKAKLHSAKHELQGRKVYLHHKDAQDGEWKNWKTTKESENLKQKSWVKPLKKNHEFYFHLDFYNLSSYELGLLLYALEPESDFHHKLGMGKSLGFGTVKTRIIDIFYIGRQKRYLHKPQLGIARTRYHGCSNGMFEALPDAYHMEKVTPQNTQYPSIETLRNEFIEDMDADIRQAITLLGNPENSIHPVQQPQIVGTEDFESESFKWFVANALGSGRRREGNQIPPAEQKLEPINRDTQELPHLARLKFNK